MKLKLRKVKRDRLIDGKIKLNKYQKGGDGFVQWCYDFDVRIQLYEGGLPVWKPLANLSDDKHQVTGRSSLDMWKEQCRIAREALEMENNEFIHRLVVFCWMRGESKSLLVCLIVLWKFLNFPNQKIMLGANSKDQSKFVHYDIIRDIILNSPRLLTIIGEKNIHEKEIRLRSSNGRIISIIRSVSSFSGILSNITGYTFSEMFDMKNPKFFTQIDGSIRNIPNAFGLIDSTVSDRTHILYQMYKSWVKNQDPTLYFSHRQSRDADSADYWNPNMTDSQLRSYETKFPPAEFAQYFKNTWESGEATLLTYADIEGMHYLGIKGAGLHGKRHNYLGQESQIRKVLNNCDKIMQIESLDRDQKAAKIKKLQSSLYPVSNIYQMKTSYLQPRMCSLAELTELGELYDTDWAILTGADRADPLKVNLSAGARTIVAVVAKGLPGSRSNPTPNASDSVATHYIYFLVHLAHIQRSDLKTIKEVLEDIELEFDGIDTFSTERWGMWDMGEWCDEKYIRFEPTTASYQKQKEQFAELFTIIRSGRFKKPPLAVKGAKLEDILIEEASAFIHNESKKFYGSPTKWEKYGVQDDSVFALAGAIYGGRLLTSDDFRNRSIVPNFGKFYKGQKLVGEY